MRRYLCRLPETYTMLTKILVLPELHYPLDQFQRQGFVVRKLDYRFARLISFKVCFEMLPESRTVGVRNRNVFRKTAIIYKIPMVPETRYLVADRLFYIRNHFVNSFSNSFHSFQHFPGKRLVVLIDILVVCLCHRFNIVGQLTFIRIIVYLKSSSLGTCQQC